MSATLDVQTVSNAQAARQASSLASPGALPPLSQHSQAAPPSTVVLAVALKYNDQSPLENHHCATLFSIILRFKVLHALTDAQRSYVRKMTISMIFATDMARHNELLNRMRTLPPLDELAPLTPHRSADSVRMRGELPPEERRTLLQSVLHAADLYTPSLPFESSLGWVDALGREFEAQVEQERMLSIQESTFLLSKDLQSRARNESGFISNIILPMWHLMSRAIPELDPCYKAALQNLERWKSLLHSDLSTRSMDASENDACGTFPELELLVRGHEFQRTPSPSLLHNLQGLPLAPSELASSPS